MRARLLRELPPDGPWDLKAMPGGMIEVEFIAQALLLEHAPHRPELWRANTSAALAALGEALYAGADPAGPAPEEELLSVARTADGFSLSMALPLARHEDLDLSRSGDELVVTVAGHRRVLALPSALRRCTVVGAVLTDGRLVVRFEPDPELWMRT